MCKNVQSVNWDDLRYVLAVSRQGNLSSAARSLGVGHTTVGRRLSAIEEALGSRLFDRQRSRYVPTLAGRRLISEANHMEARLDEVALEIGGRDQRMSGVVRVSATGTFVEGLLLPSVPAFAALYPDIELDIRSDAEVKDLARREVDIGIRSREPKNPNLIARRLCGIATGVYASREYLDRMGSPTAADGFAGHRFIRFPRSWPLEEGWIDRHAGASVSVVRVNRWQHVLCAVRRGLGIGLIECFLGDADPALVRVLPGTLFSEMWWAVVHEDMRGNARVKATLDFLVATVAEQRELLAGEVASA